MSRDEALSATADAIAGSRCTLEVPAHLVARVDRVLRSCGLHTREYVKGGQFRTEVVEGPYTSGSVDTLYVPPYLRHAG